MPKNSLTFKILSIIAVFVIVILVFSFFIQPWFLKWGATDEEIRATWPGDDLVPGSSVEYTRAITINAPPIRNMAIAYTDRAGPWRVLQL